MVEHRSFEERDAGMPELRRIPLQLAQGWGDIDAMAAGGQLLCRLSAPVTGAPRSSFQRMLRNSSASISEVSDAVDSDALSAPPADPLLNLLSLQSADGWFEDGFDEILRTAGLDVDTSKSDLEVVLNGERPIGDSTNLRRLLATLIVLRGLRRLFADRRALWRRADAKARKWVLQVIESTGRHRLSAFLFESMR